MPPQHSEAEPAPLPVVAQLCGLPASNRWFFEASEFPGETVHDPLLTATPPTLGQYLRLPTEPERLPT